MPNKVNAQRKRFWIVSALAACAAAGVLVGSQIRTNYELGSSSASRPFMGMVASAAEPVRLSDGTSAASYFDNVRRLALRHYVDPVRDMAPLSDGAVRGLVESLNSTGAEFYSKTEYQAVRDYYEGTAHGIGAYLQLVRVEKGDEYLYPLVVLAVAPGSPAEEAGIRAGDWIESLQGHWVANRSLRPEWEELHKQKDEGKISTEEFQKRLSALQEKAEKLILWDKAFHELTAVDRGAVELTILREGKEIPLKLTRRVTRFEPVSVSGSTLRIATFGKGVAEKVAEKLQSGGIEAIDVRENPGGYLEEVEKVLGLLGVKGLIGYVKPKADSPLASIETRSEQALADASAFRVLVDAGTSREAELFARALVDRGAKQDGRSAGLGIRLEFYSLETGAGFSLPTGVYYAQDKKPLLRKPFLLTVRRSDKEASD